jgi:prepilin-type processing-associated H-X9-DG protein
VQKIISLIVVGALALLGLALVLGLLVQSREQADRLRCLRSMGVLAQFAGSDYPPPHGGQLPPGTLPQPDLRPTARLSFVAELLPYLGRDDLRQRLDPAAGWREESNRSAIEPIIPVLLCPTRANIDRPSRPGPLHFLGLAGVGPDAASQKLDHAGAGCFRYDMATPLAAIRDGLSYTAMMAETSQGIGPWAAGGPSTIRSTSQTEQPVGPGRPFGGNHPGVANVAFVDGSARPVAASISPMVFAELVSIAGNGPDDW